MAFLLNIASPPFSTVFFFKTGEDYAALLRWQVLRLIIIIVTDSEDQLTHLNIRQAFQSSSSVGVARDDFEFLAIRSTRHFNDHSNSNSILKQ